MAKRLLLIDDEKFFLRSLKEGLVSLSDVFETDTCYSVNEAIKMVVTHSYDLIITDIRMPGKSGIDLLIHLRDMHYRGTVMVMSAFNTSEAAEKIKAFGVANLISKPFKLEWFKNMLLEHFKSKESSAAVTFETIDLVTVMQIVHLEKKTSALEVNAQGVRGMIYFMDGEIIHAEYNELIGEPAIMKMITLSDGSISVKNAQGRVKRTMTIPFVEYMMNIMKTIDELQRDRNAALAKQNESTEPSAQEPVNTGYEHKQNNIKENNMGLGEILNELKEIKGYLGAGVFTPQGEMLEGTAEISGIHFEMAGSLIHDTLLDAKKTAKEIGFGNLELLQFYTEMGIIFAVCYNDGKLHFHTILVIKTDGNIAMARLKLKKVVDALIPQF